MSSLALVLILVASAQDIPDDDDASAVQRRPVRVEDVVLAVPRAVLAVPRAVTFVVFEPLRPLIRFGAKHNLVGRYERLIYWDEAQTYGLRPSVGYDTNFGPTVGGALFHDNVFGHGEEGQLKASFGGRVLQSYEGSFAGDTLGGSRMWGELQGRFEANPNVIFAGFGSESLGAVTRYSQTRWLGYAATGVTLGQPGSIVQIGAETLFNNREFDDAESDRDISIEEVYDTDTLTGFEDGVTTAELGGVVRVDFTQGGIRSRGVFAQLSVAPVLTNVGDAFVHYGGEVQAGAALFQEDRMIMAHLFVEAVDGDDIPFTSLPRLGGSHRLRGYRTDRFRDKRAAGGSLAYSWPVHKNVQAQAFIDIGSTANTFGEFFDTDGWRTGGGLSLLLGSSDDVDFRAEIAYGDGIWFGLASDFRRSFRRSGRRL